MFNEKVTVVRAPTVTVPTAIYPYFDKIQFWVPDPIDRSTIAQLRRHCGRGGLHVRNMPARFSARYRQRIQFFQPSDQTLEWLAGRDDALINRAEITLDFIFNNWAEVDETFEFLHRHIVRRWHGPKQKIKIVRKDAAAAAGKKKARVVDEIERGETRYDAGRKPNKIVFYRGRHCRVTGEVYCLHLEWHLNGLKPIRAAVIESGRDLLEFNHRGFWQKRLQLFDVDRRRLGRLVRNRANGKKSKVSEIKQSGRYRINLDGRTGEVLVRGHDTVQELIDN